MPGKEKHNYVALVVFSFCTYGDNETKNFPTEKVQKQSIRSQNTFGNRPQTFQWNCSMRELLGKTWQTDKKNHFNQRPNFSDQQTEGQNCIQFTSTMSERHLRTGSKTF